MSKPRTNGVNRVLGPLTHVLVGSTLISLATTGCLQTNPRFPWEEAARLKKEAKPEPSQTQPGGEGEATSVPTQDSGTGTGASVEPPSSQHPSSNTSTDTTSSETAQSSTGVTSQDTQSTSSGATPIDPAVGRWIEIEVQTQDIAYPLPLGYALSVSFDHAQLVRDGALEDGSDLLVVSMVNDVATSLSRVLDFDSGWNRANTTLWFATDKTIAANTSTDRQYFLVAKHPSLQARNDASSVFLQHRDFRGASVDGGWSFVESGTGVRGLATDTGSWRIFAEPLASYPIVYHNVYAPSQSFPRGIRVDVKNRIPASSVVGDCGRIFPIDVRSTNNSSMRAGLRSNRASYTALSYDDDQGINQVTPVDQEPVHDTEWHVHSLVWVDRAMSYLRDDTLMLNTQSNGTIDRPDQTPLQVGMGSGAASQGCTGTGSLDLELQWMRVRHAVSPEPMVRLK